MAWGRFVRFGLFYSRWLLTLSLLVGLLGLGLGQVSASEAGDQSRRALALGSHGAMRAVHVVGSSPVDIYVEDVGRGAPIVLLHGIGGSTYSFRHVIPYLARRHRIIALDLKGFGRSEKTFDDDYTTAHQAAIVLQLMADMGLKNVTLVGHSFGGAVALKAAIVAMQARDHRIARLVLMNAPAYPQPLTRHHALMQMPVLPYLALTVVPPILSARAMLDTRRPYGPQPTDADAAAYADPLYDFAGKHALITTTRQIVAANPADVVPHYAHLRQPTLLIWCRNDPTVPEETGKRLARAMPRAHLVVLDGCTHMPAEEAPGKTLAAFERFLRPRLPQR
jgi:pimeloyl-ACP methyl ester carboxylesterase